MAVTRLGLLGLIAAGGLGGDYSGKEQVAAVPAGVPQQEVWAVDIGYYDPDTETTGTARFSTVGFTTKPTDTPANTVYYERLEQAVDLDEVLASPGKTFGGSKISAGEARISNGDGAFDWLLRMATDGRPVTLYHGRVGAPFPADWDTYTLTQEYPEGNTKEISIRLRDLQFELVSALQTEKFAGSNTPTVGGDGLDGLEGVEDLKGLPKPLLDGQAFNFSPPMVNTTRLIFMVSSEDGASIDAVRDNRVPLTKGSDYASLSELQDDALAPLAGEFRALVTDGMYFRLGSSPVGDITCDATQGATAADRTAAQLWVRTLTRAGYTSGDWSAAMVTALDAENDAVCGDWIFEERKANQQLDFYANSVGANWWQNIATGVFHIARFEPPQLSEIAARFVENDIVGLERTTAKDGDVRVPAHSYILPYRKNHTVQKSTSDIGLPGTLNPPSVTLAINDAGEISYNIDGYDGTQSLRFASGTSEPSLATVQAATPVNAQTASGLISAFIGVGTAYYMRAIAYTEADGGGYASPMGTQIAIRPLGDTSGGAAIASAAAGRWRCTVEASSATTLPHSTLTAVAYSTEIADVGNLHDAGANTRITIPATDYLGVWVFIAEPLLIAGAGEALCQVYIIKNGSTELGYCVVKVDAADEHGLSMTAIDSSPTPGDYYEVKVLQESVGSVSAQALGRFHAVHL